MRSQPKTLLIGLLLALAAGLGYVGWGALSPPAAPAPPDAAETTDAVITEAMRAWQVPGTAVAVVRDDQLVHLKGYGVKEVGRPEPVTPDTIFPLASCTKAFTTAAMALLVDEGKMDWDDPVRKHVPYFHLSDPAADALVTLRDLVSHRTGVGSNDLLWYRSPLSREELIRRIGRVKLKYPFRSGFAYQTTMFTTAGEAVERTSGRKWEEFVRQRICVPLGMAGVAFTSTAALQAADHAAPHRLSPQGARPIDRYPMPRPDPAGSMQASARDLARWLRFQLGDGAFEGRRLVSAAALAQTHTPQNLIPMQGQAKTFNPDTVQLCYGMAWVVQDYHGRRLLSHAGLIDGFRVQLTLVPDAKLGIALLNNLDRTNMNLAASNQLVDQFLDLPKRDWNAFFHEQLRAQEEAAKRRFAEMWAKRPPGARPSRELSGYAGSYENPAYGTATVSLEPNGLVWKWDRFTAALEHLQTDTFVLRDDVLGYPQVVFSPGAGGVAAMRVADPIDAEFKKAKSPR